MVSCGGVGHSEYPCGWGETCCEPVEEPDGGFDTCEDSGYTCVNLWELGTCDGSIHYELDCGSMTQLCCDMAAPDAGA